jgi:DNA-binding MarR family transcriptional regulator
MQKHGNAMPVFMSKPAAVTVLAWDRLIRAGERALSAAQAAFRKAGLPPFEWYDILLELDRAGPLRQRDLQRGLMLAQYNVSRLIDRMARAGLVRKLPCQDDHRGHEVELTEEGRNLRAQMWPVYADAIEAVVGTRVNDTERVELALLLSKVA